MKQLYILLILVISAYCPVEACSFLAEDIAFCRAARWSETSLLARGKVVEAIDGGLIVQLYEVYRGKETRCLIKVFHRPDFDCNGTLFKYGNEYLGKIGQVIAFQAEQIVDSAQNNERLGEYFHEYSEIQGFGRFWEPLVQEGSRLKGLVEDGKKSIRNKDLYQALKDCDVPMLLDAPRVLCAEDALGLFPNPATSVFYFETHDQNVEEVKLYDLQGRQYLREANYDGLAGIPLQGIPPGLYIVWVKTQGIILKNKLLVTP